MQYTDNYKFRLPDENDEFNIEDFNENSKAFDKTLKETVDAVGDMTAEAKAEIEEISDEVLQSANTAIAAAEAAESAKTAAEAAAQSASSSIEGIDQKVADAEGQINTTKNAAIDEVNEAAAPAAKTAVDNYMNTVLPGVDSVDKTIIMDDAIDLSKDYEVVLVVGKDNAMTAGYTYILGEGNSATNSDTLIAGYHNIANNGSALAVGDSNVTGGFGAVIGNENQTLSYSLAAGLKNVVGLNGAAIGSENTAEAIDNCLLVGVNNTANNTDSAAIGQYNTVGQNSAAIGNGNQAIGMNVLALGMSNKPQGSNSLSVGIMNTAGKSKYSSGTSLAVGAQNNVGDYSAAIGTSNTATDLSYCTLVGFKNTVTGASGTAFGYSNTVDTISIAAGQNNKVGSYSAVFGYGNTAEVQYSLVAGYSNTTTGDSTVAVGRENTISNKYVFVFGDSNTASGDTNLIIGSSNTTTKGTGAMNTMTFVLGISNTVKAAKYGYTNFALGSGNNIYGTTNFVLGSRNTLGKDENSDYNDENTVFGSDNNIAQLTTYGGGAFVKGNHNETGGMSVIGNDNKLGYVSSGLAIGHDHSTDAETSGYLGASLIVGTNLQLNTSSNPADANYTQQTFIVGRYNNSANQGYITVGAGTSDARNNVFRVGKDGTTYLKSTATSGADYSEMFEYADGNEAGEDRRGLIVALDGEKIKLADSETDIDDVIGIVSANPSVVGDAQGENWNDKYLKDVFGQIIYEDVEIPEHTETKPIKDEFGNIVGEEEFVVEAKIERQAKLNPEFDPTKEYVSRENRKEWAAVGMVGKLVVVTDGTVKVNKYIKPADGGIATLSDTKTNMRVMKVIDDTHALVLVK